MEYFSILLNVIIILFLVALNGFFVASEFSIVKVRPSRLDTLIKEGNRQAVYARQVTEHLDAYLSVTQLGITLASLGLGWIGEPAVAKMLTPLFHLFNIPAQLEHTHRLRCRLLCHYRTAHRSWRACTKIFIYPENRKSSAVYSLAP